jgi:hypothetical protein
MAQVCTSDRLPYHFTRLGTLEQLEELGIETGVSHQPLEVRDGLEAARRGQRRLLPRACVQLPEAGSAQTWEWVVEARLARGDVLPVIEVGFDQQGRDFDSVVVDLAEFKAGWERDPAQARAIRDGWLEEQRNLAPNYRAHWNSWL